MNSYLINPSGLDITLSPQVILAIFLTAAVMLILMGVALVVRYMFHFMRSPSQAVPKTPEVRSEPIVGSQSAAGTLQYGNTAFTATLANRNLDDLLSIEESLLAVRELYERRLIPASVYISESLKYAG